MSLITLNTSQKRILRGLTYAAILIGLFFLRNYLMLIIFSAIMATLFGPQYDKFKKKGFSDGASSFYTFTISMLVVIVPVIFVGFITFFQVQKIATAVSEQNYSVDVTELSGEVVVVVNDTMEDLGVSYRLTEEELTETVSSAAATFGQALFSGVINTFAGFFGLITAAIIYIYVFLSMLVNKDKLLSIFKRLNPLGDEVSDLYIDRASAMTKATVRGQFIIALMQGFASAIVLAIAGPSGLFFFFLVLLTVMSVIPLGAGIITIPIGIIMMLTGNIPGGIFVIANHLIIVTNIDNIMRPKLVPRSARLDPALMILAVFAGLAIYGFLGIVIGPIIMILVVTTVQIYSEVFFMDESIDRKKYPKKQSSYSKIKSKLSQKSS